MAPVREHANSTPKKKHQSDGERFQSALGLEKQSMIFCDIKKTLRRLADKNLKFDMPVFQQATGMALFVEDAIESFPAFFNETHPNNGERLRLLQHYCRSYLEKSGKMTTSKKPPAKPRYIGSLSDYVPSSAPAVRRAQPTSARQRAMSTQAKDKMAALSTTKSLGLRTKNVSPKRSAVGSPSTALAASFRSEVGSPQPENGRDAILEFLDGCYPPMTPCYEAFQCAGITACAHLQGMAHWPEERLRKFLTRNNIVRTPLEAGSLVCNGR
ncbi:hypothetical protein B0H10DRAFT_617509 [Mycena sp. CBHHK59/15]|nr:hypothetical protein B0H10DRAFT_617509 [Mycena sp. CBHHK59/15]